VKEGDRQKGGKDSKGTEREEDKQGGGKIEMGQRGRETNRDGGKIERGEEYRQGGGTDKKWRQTGSGDGGLIHCSSMVGGRLCLWVLIVCRHAWGHPCWWGVVVFVGGRRPWAVGVHCPQARVGGVLVHGGLLCPWALVFVGGLAFVGGLLFMGELVFVDGHRPWGVFVSFVGCGSKWYP
jgi:hypothetical protein